MKSNTSGRFAAIVPAAIFALNMPSLGQQTINNAPTGSAPAPLRVVDSFGNEVGLATDDILTNNIRVLRYFATEGIWVIAQAKISGIEDEPIPSYFESTDCSGPRYLRQYQPDLFSQPGLRIGSNFYYATDTNQSRNIRSSRFGPVRCKPENFTGVFATMSTIPVSDFGTPPFRLAR